MHEFGLVSRMQKMAENRESLFRKKHSILCPCDQAASIELHQALGSQGRALFFAHTRDKAIHDAAPGEQGNGDSLTRETGSA